MQITRVDRVAGPVYEELPETRLGSRGGRHRRLGAAWARSPWLAADEQDRRVARVAHRVQMSSISSERFADGRHPGLVRKTPPSSRAQRSMRGSRREITRGESADSRSVGLPRSHRPTFGPWSVERPARETPESSRELVLGQRLRGSRALARECHRLPRDAHLGRPFVRCDVVHAPRRVEARDEVARRRPRPDARTISITPAGTRSNTDSVTGRVLHGHALAADVLREQHSSVRHDASSPRRSASRRCHGPCRSRA